MKRQRGRNRNGGTNNSSSNKPQPHNANRAFDSNGPEGVKVRGNPQHVFEKYQQLARDANAAGDRVLGENYLQHAEHYFRLLRALQPNRPASEIIGRDQFASGYDIDFEDETGQAQAIAADEAAAATEAAGGIVEARDDGENRDRNRSEWQPREERPREERPRDERPRDERPRDERPREDRPRNDSNGGGRDRFRDRDGRDNNRDRNRPRDDRPRDDRPRDERPREDRPRDERPRDDRPREDRPRSDGDEPRRDRQDREPVAAVEPPPSGPMLRDAEGGASHAPAFLQARPVVPSVEPGEEKPARPKRRRAPRTFEGDAAAPVEGGDEG